MRVSAARATMIGAVVAALAMTVWAENSAQARRFADTDEGALPPAPVQVAVGVLGDARPTLPAERPDGAVPVLVADARLSERVASLERPDPRQTSAASQSYSAYGIACRRPDLSVTALPGGFLRLEVAAPCLPATPVEVTYGALRFRLPLDGFGRAAQTLPALAQKSSVTAEFADGSRVIRRKTVADFDRGRVTVLLNDETGPEPASSAPVFRALLDAVTGAPLELLSVEGGGQLSLDTGAAPDLCGRDLQGWLLQGAEEGEAQRFAVAMPDCTLAGARIVLDFGRLAGGPDQTRSE
ncbi:hypothetical protein [Albidovulum sediminis]|uniref:GerMN domain-containing protein n=1 Tax=Albidovulum sediminis TaxID=3066345 RepID=A0ABT2NQZ3_9RHOB|nr:hypothetical protein [Defluviimonas sediminis]MCT8331346.1 hypothetical protein [Defluviimonas sediminis]